MTDKSEKTATGRAKIKSSGARRARAIYPSHASLKSAACMELEAMGFAAVFCDASDTSLFLSDVYSSRREARSIAVQLNERLLGIAAIVMIEDGEKQTSGT